MNLIVVSSLVKLDLGDEAGDVVFLTAKVPVFVLAPLNSFVCEGTMAGLVVRETLCKRRNTESGILRLWQIATFGNVRLDAMADNLLVVEVVGDAVRGHDYDIVVIDGVLEDLFFERSLKVATALLRAVEFKHVFYRALYSFDAAISLWTQDHVG